MTIYSFVIDATSLATFLPSVSITIGGGGTFADLPTLNNYSAPAPAGGYDFGNLQALSISWQGSIESSFTLADFTCGAWMNGYCAPLPWWNISPTGINFLDHIGGADFHLTFSDVATVRAAQDYGICFFGCLATGHWVDPPTATVPEPSSAVLLLGVCAATLIARRLAR